MTTDKISSPKDVKPMSIKGQIGLDNIKKEYEAEQKHMINVKKGIRFYFWKHTFYFLNICTGRL